MSVYVGMHTCICTTSAAHSSAAQGRLPRTSGTPATSRGTIMTIGITIIHYYDNNNNTYNYDYYY